MQEKLSIKWNLVKFYKKSLYEDVEDILQKRFWDNYIFDKWIKDLYDPLLLCWMKDAVKRIIQAKKNEERIMIFWDYDVDGVTSTSILMHFFKKVGIQASYRLPHRINDWYGLKKYFIDEMSSLWVSLVITVDCGTRDIEVIKYAKDKWIDVIVTDHHSVPEIIPKEAISVINPKRKDCLYPFKELSWAWVAFKLMSALAKEILPEKEATKYIEESIDIAAIWTVADCMTLTWENRIIVENWLKQLKKSRSRWIKKLIKDRINDDLDSDIFSFLIWPKLNSAWRLDTPYKAVNLILNNSDSVEETIQEIEILNEKRRKLTYKYYDLALEKVNINDNLIFYESDEINHGIIWILAWKLTEKYYKPSIVLIEEDDKFVASCRSPDYFSIVEILEKYKDYFLAFWWHKQAAWFSILKSKYKEFKEKILQDVNKEDFTKFKKTIYVDKLIKIDDLGFNFLDKVNRFKPFWLWNPKPIFMIEDFKYENLSYLWKWVEHIKFYVKSWHKIVWFFLWDYFKNIKKSSKIDLIFELNIDNFNWNRNLQLNVIDFLLDSK